MTNKDENKTIHELLNLAGRTALVTGGAGHLGKAISRALAELGAHVVVASRSIESCERFAGELVEEGFTASPLQLDISDSASRKAAVDTLLADGHSIDVLVNNAYAFLEKPIDEITDDEFTATIETSLTGTFRLSQLVSIPMRRAGCGSIINIASMYAMVGSYPEMYEDVPLCISPSYHASKGGLLQLTRYLAVYWAQYGIRVNAISPGTFGSISLKRDHPEIIKRLEQRVPLKRIGEPHELKGVIMLLASDAGSYITGANLVVDGGWTAW